MVDKEKKVKGIAEEEKCLDAYFIGLYIILFFLLLTLRININFETIIIFGFGALMFGFVTSNRYVIYTISIMGLILSIFF